VRTAALTGWQGPGLSLRKEPGSGLLGKPRLKKLSERLGFSGSPASDAQRQRTERSDRTRRTGPQGGPVRPGLSELLKGCTAVLARVRAREDVIFPLSARKASGAGPDGLGHWPRPAFWAEPSSNARAGPTREVTEGLGGPGGPPKDWRSRIGPLTLLSTGLSGLLGRDWASGPIPPAVTLPRRPFPKRCTSPGERSSPGSRPGPMALAAGAGRGRSEKTEKEQKRAENERPGRGHWPRPPRARRPGPLVLAFLSELSKSDEKRPLGLPGCSNSPGSSGSRDPLLAA